MTDLGEEEKNYNVAIEVTKSASIAGSDDDEENHPFSKLTPDFILDAIDSFGYQSDGRILTLNSYENRVYQIGIEDIDTQDNAPLIAKFYRPERWSENQLREEHEFCFELEEAELPVVPPLKKNQKSLLQYQGFHIALFERKGGHAPELDNLDNLFTLGRFLGRIHAIGQSKPFEHRTELNPITFGHEKAQFVIDHAIPFELKTAYSTLTKDLLIWIEKAWEEAGDFKMIRTHGDCHPGNILWRDDNPHFVDFDDSRMAPAIQDLWMLLSGDRINRVAQMSEVLEGYQEFCDFNMRELHLIEALRALRMIHHTAWIAQRWQDPAFPSAFPQFDSVNYWEQHILDLRAQFAELQEESLALF